MRFFLFRMVLLKLIKAGVKLIIQPGGSKRDADAIKVANKAERLNDFYKG